MGNTPATKFKTCERKGKQYTEDEIRNASAFCLGAIQCSNGVPVTVEEERTLIKPSLGDYSCSIGLIMATYTNKDGHKSERRSTGTLIKYIDKYYIILTCAHACIIKEEEDDKDIEIEAATFYLAISNSHLPKGYPIEKWIVHPKYEKLGYKYYNGTDFAVLFLSSDIDIDLSVTNANLGIVNDYDTNLTYKVYGYPADNNQIDPYEMDGKNFKYERLRKGNILKYTDIKATAGQSGGPVFVNREPGFWTLIGVHVAKSASGIYFASPLTPSINGWILDAVNTFFQINLNDFFHNRISLIRISYF